MSESTLPEMARVDGAAGARHPAEVLEQVIKQTLAPTKGVRLGELSESTHICVHYVSAHFRDEVTLDDLSRVCGLSKFHFIRKFHEEAGLTPGVFLQCYRVAQAMDQLARSRRPIHEIARDVGYGDAAAFSRAFRRVAGVQPYAYRKRKRMAVAGRRIDAVGGGAVIAPAKGEG